MIFADAGVDYLKSYHVNAKILFLCVFKNLLTVLQLSYRLIVVYFKVFLLNLMIIHLDLYIKV